MTYLLGRGEADTVPRRPAVHLALRATAEPQQLCPELLNEVQQSRNRGLLLFVGAAEREARDMHMKSAGSGGVAEIAHALRLAQHLRPRHFVQVILERHWMGNKLHAFIQAAVRLDVQVLRVRIGDIQQLLRVIAVGAAVINFELNAEMTQAFSVEYKVGRVAVLMNNVTVLIPAGRAISVVVTVPVRAVTPQNAVAICTTDVILSKQLSQSV